LEQYNKEIIFFIFFGYFYGITLGSILLCNSKPFQIGCTVVFETVTVTLPTVGEMLESELTKKSLSQAYRRLQYGQADKEKSVWVLIPKDIRKLRIRLLSSGNNIGAGRIIPGVGPKIPKTSGNAADIIFSDGKRHMSRETDLPDERYQKRASRG